MADRKLKQASASVDKASAARDATIYKLMQAQIAVMQAENVCGDCGGGEMFAKAMEDRDEAIHALIDAEIAFGDAIEVWAALDPKQREDRATH